MLWFLDVFNFVSFYIPVCILLTRSWCLVDWIPWIFSHPAHTKKEREVKENGHVFQTRCLWAHSVATADTRL